MDQLSAFGINGFSFEMSILLLAIVLGLFHLGGQALISDVERGVKWAFGPRDTKPEISVRGQRFERASTNFKETFPYMMGILLLIEITGRGSNFTQITSLTWLLARVIYYPAYILGWPIRSWVWVVALLAMSVLGASLFFPL